MFGGKPYFIVGEKVVFYWRKGFISRIERRFTARVCASDKLCGSFFLLPRARFHRPIAWGGDTMTASVSSETSIESHDASDSLYLHLQSSIGYVTKRGLRERVA